MDKILKWQKQLEANQTGKIKPDCSLDLFQGCGVLISEVGVFLLFFVFISFKDKGEEQCKGKFENSTFSGGHIKEVLAKEKNSEKVCIFLR